MREEYQGSGEHQVKNHPRPYRIHEHERNGFDHAHQQGRNGCTTHASQAPEDDDRQNTSDPGPVGRWKEGMNQRK